MLQRNQAHVPQLLSLRAATAEALACNLCSATRSHRNEKPVHHNEEQSLLTATRESLHAAMKHGAAKIKTYIQMCFFLNTIFKKKNNLEGWMQGLEAWIYGPFLGQDHCLQQKKLPPSDSFPAEAEVVCTSGPLLGSARPISCPIQFRHRLPGKYQCAQPPPWTQSLLPSEQLVILSARCILSNHFSH